MFFSMPLTVLKFSTFNWLFSYVNQSVKTQNQSLKIIDWKKCRRFRWDMLCPNQLSCWLGIEILHWFGLFDPCAILDGSREINRCAILRRNGKAEEWVWVLFWKLITKLKKYSVRRLQSNRLIVDFLDVTALVSSP